MVSVLKNQTKIRQAATAQFTDEYLTIQKDHPEWREVEKIRNNEREKKKYSSDPDYKEQVKKRALEQYYRLKEAKLNASISVSYFFFNLSFTKNDIRIKNYIFSQKKINSYVFV